MLLTRSIPPPFLLPSCGARQLAQTLQRACMSDSTSKRTFQVRKAIPRQPKQSNPPKLSLFDELFPEERESGNDGGEVKVDKLPPFQFDQSLEKKTRRVRDRPSLVWKSPGSKHNSTGELPSRTGQTKQEDEKQMLDAAVLILNSASKRLEESDFLRIGHKGAHIQGWTTGIIKVIQVRDESTLEPLGLYFIVFSSDSAARVYLDQAIRLHRLSKAYAGSLIASTLPPPPGLVKDGEDPKLAVKSFTLVPGQARLSLRLAIRPYRAAMTRILSEGGSHGISSWQSKGEGLVLFSLDVGNIALQDLRDTLGRDGRRRNLQWALAGNSFINIEGRQEVDGNDRMPDEVLPRTNMPRSPSKYIIAFKDRNEARTFVREWHRRPLPLKREHSPGDEAPPIVNAQIVW